MEHLIIFVGCAVFVMLTSVAHEVRNTLRERHGVVRHDQVVRALSDMRALTLGAISQRTNLEGDVRELRAILTDHADLLDEVRPAARPARRPRPA